MVIPVALQRIHDSVRPDADCKNADDNKKIHASS